MEKKGPKDDTEGKCEVLLSNLDEERKNTPTISTWRESTKVEKPTPKWKAAILMKHREQDEHSEIKKETIEENKVKLWKKKKTWLKLEEKA